MIFFKSKNIKKLEQKIANLEKQIEGLDFVFCHECEARIFKREAQEIDLISRTFNLRESFDIKSFKIFYCVNHIKKYGLAVETFYTGCSIYKPKEDTFYRKIKGIEFACNKVGNILEEHL